MLAAALGVAGAACASPRPPRETSGRTSYSDRDAASDADPLVPRDGAATRNASAVEVRVRFFLEADAETAGARMLWFVAEGAAPRERVGRVSAEHRCNVAEDAYP